MRSMLRMGLVGSMLVGAFAVYGCSTQEGPAPFGTSSLKGATDKDPNTGTVDFYAPDSKEVVLEPGADPAQAALDWIEAHKVDLGIPDARKAYTPMGVTKDDEDGMTHVKLQHMAGGLPVWGIETTVSFDDAGAVALLDGPYIPNLEAIAATKPTVDESQAQGIAEADAKEHFETTPSASGGRPSATS